MNVTIDPGTISGGGKRTAIELRVEWEDGAGQSGMLYVTEYRGAMLVTVSRGDAIWRIPVDPRNRKRPMAPILSVEPVGPEE